MDDLLRAQAAAVMQSLTEDQVRRVLDFVLELREAADADLPQGLEVLLEEPA